MKRRGLQEQIVAAARAEIGYVLLAVAGVTIGAVQVFYELVEPAEFVLFVISGALTLLGGAGFGTAIGQERADENLRLKLEPPYRRTTELYDGLARLQFELSATVTDTASETRPTGVVSARVVQTGHVAIDRRLDEQVRSLDKALAEWRELVPEKVDETVEKLRKEGRLT